MADPSTRRSPADPAGVVAFAGTERSAVQVVDPVAALGGKGAGLVAMAALGLRVPPGFVVPTGACRAYLRHGWSAQLEAAVRDGVVELERVSGRRLGDPAAPLLVSVRSGAAVSMPGMMDTALNVGITPAVAAALADSTGDAAFAVDTYRRAVLSWAGVVCGAPGSALGELRSVDLGSDPARAGGVLGEVLVRAGCDLPPDPVQQVLRAVRAVFESWNGARARTYRRVEGIDDDLGTAVVVQQMVFGNLGDRSGTGVAFSRDPATGHPGLVGDFLAGAQGEDVVAGAHRTLPLLQMASRWPDVWRDLAATAAVLEHHHADMVDIEFTVERGELYVLQCRSAKRSPAAAFRVAIDMAEDPDFPVDRAEAVRRCAHLLADPPRVAASVPDGSARELVRGIAASPGRASGVLSLDPDDAVERSARGEPVVLVRRETSPADIHGIAASVGLVTTLGGLVSHAAVVARSWGMPAVVGVEGLEIAEHGIIARGTLVAVGEVVTVDGTTGVVLVGSHAGAERPIPEVATIRAWARSERAEPLPAPPVARDASEDDVLRDLSLKGAADVEALAAALQAPEDEIEGLLGRLGAEELVRAVRGARFAPSASGRAKLEAIFADERAGSEDRFVALLEAFARPDARLKELMAAWQQRTVDGEAVVNDHSDAAYDASVLELIRTEVHDEALDVVDRAASELPRLALYAARLDAALAFAADGDARYVAHPMLDSYHTVWFELHEELILLAGRDRRSEAEAGRA